MPTKLDWIESSESGNWNVAGDYAKLKIMKLLYEADQYEIIATFGTTNIQDEFQLNKEMMDYARIKAFYRLLKCVQMVINNTVFAVKIKYREDLKAKRDQVNQIIKVSKRVEQKIMKNGKLTKIKINDDVFDKLLNMIIEIKADILEPLNKSNLIFMEVEEFDPKAIKSKIMDELTSVG